MTDQPQPSELQVLAQEHFQVLAQLDEANSLIATLRGRCATLNVEIRLRDNRLAALEQDEEKKENPDG